MTLNPALLKDTLERASKENGGLTPLGMRFYARLFEKYPQVRPLFNTPPEEQHKKLVASLGAIVASVSNPETLLPYLHAMGIRHLKYQTEPGHYDAVAENLLAVLDEHLSVEGEWAAEHHQAWSDALQAVASIMIEAASNPTQFETELSVKGYRPDGFKQNNAEPWELPTSA